MKFSNELIEHLRKSIGDREDTTDVPAVLVVPLLDEIGFLRARIAQLELQDRKSKDYEELLEANIAELEAAQRLQSKNNDV